MQNSTNAVIIAIAVIVALSVAEFLINVKKLYRCRQAAVSYAAIIVACTGMIAGIVCLYYVQSLIDQLNDTSVLYGLLYIKDAESNRFYIRPEFVTILNWAILILFVLVKAVMVPILRKKWNNFGLLKASASKFYEIDEFSGMWFVKNQYIGMRRILFGFSICSAVISCALLSATIVGGYQGGFFPICFPVAAQIIITEAWCFLNGMTKAEYLDMIGGDDTDVEKIGEYYRIKDVYEDIFPQQLIASHLCADSTSHKGTTHVLQSLVKSEDPIERNVGRFFSTYDDNTKLDVDCIYAANEMMHGHSIVFFNPFYMDLEAYIILPMLDKLMNNEKCLVVLGRNSTTNDVVDWLNEVMGKYSRLRYLWRTQELGLKDADCEIGVISFKQLYDIDVIESNSEFLADVGFLLMLEPSAIVNTGQIGLSILSDKTRAKGREPVICICDRLVDGLLDTMSHVMKTEIVSVVAPPVPKCVHTGMAFDATADFIGERLFGKQTRYMGNGIELAAVAVKNQIPNVVWYSDTKAPVRDIRWISGQNFSSVCKYMNVNIHQRSIDEKIKFVSNIWGNKASSEQFLIVEDEFCNLFGMMKTFLSRGKSQIFTNVMSENYLLRDYMRCNKEIFLANPNAVPSLVPDYARSERNGLMKLIIMMAMGPVSEAQVKNELELSGCYGDDICQELSRLIRTYTRVEDTVIDINTEKSHKNYLTGRPESYYSISHKKFKEYFSDSLKNAFYIVEDERRGTECIDAKLYGYITQLVLPGQFLTYAGKYYLVKSVSPDIGVVLRRASDLYTGRKYYRQLRQYNIESVDNVNIVSYRKISDIELCVVRSDFLVITNGYLEMGNIADLRNAKEIRFDGDPQAKYYNRSYRNKSMLRIKLPESDNKVRFTLCVLLSELFKTVFPDAWPYLAVVSVQPEEVNAMLGKVNYGLSGEVEEDYIYIIEDSSIDLGLIDAVENNLQQFLEIINDYLEWHFEKMKERPSKDPAPPPIEVPKAEEITKKTELNKIQKLFARLAERLRLKKEKKKDDEGEKEPQKPDDIETKVGGEPDSEPEVENTEEGAEPEEKIGGGVEGAGAEVEGDFEKPESPESQLGVDDKENGSDKVTAFIPSDADDEDSDGTIVTSDDELVIKDDVPDNLDILLPIEPTRYQKECFIKFGFDSVDPNLAIDDLKSYLNARGCSNGALKKARTHTTIEEFEQALKSGIVCDFCQLPISGVSYEKLSDGRIRCNDCSSTAIESEEEFREHYAQVKMMFNNIYGVEICNPIYVKMTAATEIAKQLGEVFVSTNGFDPRSLGFARNNQGRFFIYVENGAPRLAAIDTMAHELTHIWQYINWNAAEIGRIYAQADSAHNELARAIVYEGMAMWSATQYLYAIGETYYAQKRELVAERRKDCYGYGFRLYRDRYRLAKDGEKPRYTPFNGFPPIDPKFVTAAVKEMTE